MSRVIDEPGAVLAWVAGAESWPPEEICGGFMAGDGDQDGGDDDVIEFELGRRR